MVSARPPASIDPHERLIGAEVPSDVTEGTFYRLIWQLGEGGMSVVFYALRCTVEGEVPVVMKMLKPAFAQRAGPTAALIVKKEAIALGRLNEHVPPTPFVVRFIDTGTFPVPYRGDRVEVPWVVVEYVHGGAEGTTLSERVDHSLRATGAAFDPVRAARAIENLTSGLAAVHDVGVIHRDLKPDNVLCCGFGDDEIFKLADFGVASPAGIATFSGAVVGTPGFVAPELTVGDPRAIGTWSDVFSLAAVIFFLLTGEDYFTARTPVEALTQAIAGRRKSLLDTAGLSPELRAREHACRGLDAALAAATAGKTENRPQRADQLATMLLPWLRVQSIRSGRYARRLATFRDEDEDPTHVAAWRWNAVRCAPGGATVRCVAWDGDGRAMAATSGGLAFWSGASWAAVPQDALPDISHPGGRPRAPSDASIRFVQRVGAGQWVIGADGPTFATYGSEGVTDVVRLEKSPFSRFDLISGDLSDLAVLVGQTPGGPPTLCALTGRRFLKPLPLPQVAAISSLARVRDAEWLVAGRGADGRAFAAVYAPLEWELDRIHGPSVRAYLACAGQFDRELGLVAGVGGAVVLRQGSQVAHEAVEGAPDLSAAAVDAVGRGWAASAGRIWMRRPGSAERPARWECIWEDAGWTAPIVSLFADLGMVVAMTADGGVIEGRMMKVTLATDD